MISALRVYVLTAMLALAAMLAMSLPAAAAPVRGGAVAAAGTVAAGSNLLGNPRGTTGDASAQGWDEVTIPGWQVSAGLPTVVRYGTPGFPAATGKWPASQGRIFAGGAGGTSRLVQSLPLHVPSGQPAPAGTRYRLSAWLGGTKTSWAEVTVRFLSAGGAVLAQRTIGPVGRSARTRLESRAGGGILPAGVASAQVTLVLATSLTNYNGPYAPQVGYNRAVAADLGLTVSAVVSRPAPPAPPVSAVPGYQHVFLFYFENQDFSQIVGNTKQAPFMNSLLRQGSLLSQFYAEEHPSDANYTALAGGSAFGIPLDDPAEENPQYTINARNIGDLSGAAHESWKTYLQSANGPCDDTVHTYYWDDDQPMMYFGDVRGRPAYCASHVVPLESLPYDLASASTTPNFAWISPDDCSDMEGCGIRAGDDFLAAELGQIMRSPAWTTQRSLAIITFDEDFQDGQHPAQRTPTIILGSAGVRPGYVSPVRYTHYSLLRTIEAALGLGTLTRNDRFAQPVNDIFSPSAPGAVAPSAAAPAVVPAPAGIAPVVSRGAARGSSPPTAWVANYGSATVTPVNLASRKAGKAIKVGTDPAAVAVTPDGRTVYVANEGSNTVTPIDTVTRRPGRAIKVGTASVALLITPNGRTLYVANEGAGTVTPVDVATGRPGSPVIVGAGPRAIAMTPGGRIAYVLNWAGGSITPIDTVTGDALAPVRVGSFPVAIAMSARTGTAYVASFGSDTVTPISLATNAARPAIPAGFAPDSVAVTPDGKHVVVSDGDSDIATVIDVPGGVVRHVGVGYSPDGVAVSGSEAYVVNTISGTVTPIATSSGRRGPAVNVGAFSYPTGMVITGSTGVVLDTYGGQVSLFSTRTRHAYAPITVGDFPVALAITG
jgi:YVTN family beta-propeller protein